MALAGVFTAFAILVSIFGVASMLALSIAQRQKDLALLRAVGATPRHLRRLISPRDAAAGPARHRTAYFPAGSWASSCSTGWPTRDRAAAVAFQQGWIPAVAAMVVAILAAVAGALGAGRRASRIKPSQALAEVSSTAS